MAGQTLIGPDPSSRSSPSSIATSVRAIEPDLATLDVTHDKLLRGRLHIDQPRRGYRTNLDALLLADFTRTHRPAARAVDLGCGIGAVGIALVVLGLAARATLVDVDRSLVGLARTNADASSVGDRVEAVVADVASLPSSLHHAFDLVVANPPYGSTNRSSTIDTTDGDPVLRSRAASRIGSEGTLASFARAARVALGKAGRACFVWPARDVVALFDALRAVGLEPKRMRFVHPLPNRVAEVALVEAKPARAGGLRVAAPLVVMEAPGVWTSEAQAIVDGDAAPPVKL